MIKILCISSNPPTARTGVVTYYKKLCGYFEDDEDLDFDLLTTADITSFEKKVAGIVRRLIVFLSFKNKRIVRFSATSNLKLILLFALLKRKNKAYDVIHAQDIDAGFIAKGFFSNRMPLILTCHFNDNPVDEEILRFNFQERERDFLSSIYKEKFAAVDKFIFVSKYAFDKSKFLLPSGSGAEIIHNGAIFGNTNTDRNENEVLQIINVGFVEARKNQKALIEIAKELIKRGFPKFHITLVGDGYDLEEIKNQVVATGLTDYFTFPGWISNTVDYLKNSDLYIHTAINDNCPYSIIEAISNDVPVIAFRVGGIPEIVESKYLFDVNDFSGVVEFILENHWHLKIIAEQQNNRISKTFSEKYQFERTKEVLLSLKPESVLTPVLQ